MICKLCLKHTNRTKPLSGGKENGDDYLEHTQIDRRKKKRKQRTEKKKTLERGRFGKTWVYTGTG